MRKKPGWKEEANYYDLQLIWPSLFVLFWNFEGLSTLVAQILTRATWPNLNLPKSSLRLCDFLTPIFGVQSSGIPGWSQYLSHSPWSRICSLLTGKLLISSDKSSYLWVLCRHRMKIGPWMNENFILFFWFYRIFRSHEIFLLNPKIPLYLKK